MNNNEHSPAAAVTDACDVFMNDRPRQVNELAYARVRVSCLGATGCYYDVTARLAERNWANVESTLR